MKRKYLLLLSKVEEKWFHIENTEEIFRLGNKEQEHNSEEKTCQEIVYLFCSECDKMQQQKMGESFQKVPQYPGYRGYQLSEALNPFWEKRYRVKKKKKKEKYLK